jgi:glycosyltransferase involved in cell wall biosynthesis
MVVRGAPTVALLYDDNAYVEPEAGAAGLMGRQVAGQAFLRAYLRHGRFEHLIALIDRGKSVDALVKLWHAESAVRNEGRVLRVLNRADLGLTMLEADAPRIIHYPQPPDQSLVWQRQLAGRHSHALTGVTHTLASPEAVALLRGLVTAPFEPYDALICTSRAVASMVREITGTYADHLRTRLGCASPRAGQSSEGFPLRLETIPLGVDTDRFHPASVAERLAARHAIGVSAPEVAILFVGRISHHAKAHPFPMFRAVSHAAAATGRSVHLILAGWAAHHAVHSAFLEGARTFAPEVRTTIVDGRDDQTRRSVWHAADVFVSPSDNIQETFGLAVIEAMASGLPVVASDWDGYRDLVIHGETGLLIPTAMVEGATATATSRLLAGALTYDQFLAECSQATMVDVAAMSRALATLVADDSLRSRMGAAGRSRARERFAWPLIVRAYEDLWQELDIERSTRAQSESAIVPLRPTELAAYPAPERTFRAYPTRWLSSTDRLVATPTAFDELETLLAMPLVHHVAAGRSSDVAVLREALAQLPCSVEQLDAFWAKAGLQQGAGRATLAWLLKYDLARTPWADQSEQNRLDPRAE